MIRQIEPPEGGDPLDATGRRCGKLVGEVGPCHRRFDHIDEDKRHWAIRAGQWYEYEEST